MLALAPRHQASGSAHHHRRGLPSRSSSLVALSQTAAVRARHGRRVLVSPPSPAAAAATPFTPVADSPSAILAVVPRSRTPKPDTPWWSPSAPSPRPVAAATPPAIAERVPLDNVLFEQFVAYAGSEADALAWLSYLYTTHMLPNMVPAACCRRHAPGMCLMFGSANHGRARALVRHDALRVCVAHFTPPAERDAALRQLRAAYTRDGDVTAWRKSTKSPCMHVSWFHAQHVRLTSGDAVQVAAARADMDRLRHRASGETVDVMRHACGQVHDVLCQHLTRRALRCGIDCCVAEHLILGSQAVNMKIDEAFHRVLNDAFAYHGGDTPAYRATLACLAPLLAMHGGLF